MQRWLLLLLALVASTADAGRLTTFAWDADANWPVGTTVELCGNGDVCQTGITGTQATLDLPVQPGEVIQGRVRAVAPAGYQCGDPPVHCPYSEWATVAQTWPAMPVGAWARFLREDNVMAVEYISFVKITTVSQSVTVPTDATLAVFCTGEYDTTTSHTLGGSSFTTAVTAGVGADMPQRITYLVSPATGSQTFAFASTPGDSFSYGHWLIFLKGVDTGNPIVSTALEETAVSPISGLTAGAGDLMIGRIFGNYNSSVSVATGGQTQIATEPERSACGYELAATDFVWTISGGSPIVGIAAVFRAGGATSLLPSTASRFSHLLVR